MFGVGTGAQLTLRNLTVTKGSSAFDGGGIWNTVGKVTVSNSTFSGNSAQSGGGGIHNDFGSTTLKNTIMANSPSGGNCAEAITDDGGNLDDGTTCGFTASSSKSDTPAGLDPAGLQNNGGPTNTIALQASNTVSAQGANDLMCGGNGNDRLTGGLGADRFGGGSGTDTATDFNEGQGDTKAGIP